jgi:carboxymethylenebutenolidase
MLIQKTFHDVKVTHGGDVRPMRIFVIAPNVPDYPQARFPGPSRSLYEH